MVTNTELINNEAGSTGLAAGYVCVSADSDDALLHADVQKLAIERLAEECGENVVEWYVDWVSNGRSLERPALQRLLADAESGDKGFDRVLVYGLDRLSRTTADLMTVCCRLEDAGIEVVSVQDL